MNTKALPHNLQQIFVEIISSQVRRDGTFCNHTTANILWIVPRTPSSAVLQCRTDRSSDQMTAVGSQAAPRSTVSPQNCCDVNQILICTLQGLPCNYQN